MCCMPQVLTLTAPMHTLNVSQCAGLDVEFMLHLLLDIYSRISKKRRFDAMSPAVVDDAGVAAGADASGELAGALQHVLGDVTAEPAFPQLQSMDAKVWQKWQVSNRLMRGAPIPWPE